MESALNMSRRELERASRRRFILDAARGLLASKGIESTSMDDIAAAADYTRRTLYAYFESRDEILLSIFIEDLASRWAVQKEAIAFARTGLERIVAWGESLYSYARQNPQAMLLQIYWDFRGIDHRRISERVFREFETVNNELAQGLRDIFRKGVKDGSLRPDLNIDLCISQYIYTLRSILNRALSPAYSFAKFEPDEYLAHYLDLFSRSIRNTGVGKK